ncbi:hypothetical protein C8R47DRAFT_1148847 [Mycena vitilis]|nr:hypothetical protein C8R47DRAFT_1148847 [Mycena vitilis]
MDLPVSLTLLKSVNLLSLLVSALPAFFGLSSSTRSTRCCQLLVSSYLDSSTPSWSETFHSISLHSLPPRSKIANKSLSDTKWSSALRAVGRTRCCWRHRFRNLPPPPLCLSGQAGTRYLVAIPR